MINETKTNFEDNFSLSLNLHSLMSNYLNERGAQIEDLSDQHRIMAQFMRQYDGVKPKRGYKPEYCSATQTYMQKLMFTDSDEKTRWLIFDDECGVCDISDTEPFAKDYS